jgi:tetratricopeptide (TPR) repeat protein
VNLLNQVGSSYLDICDYERAEKLFQEVVNFNPYLGYSSLAWLHRTNGNWKNYKDYLDKCCSLDSSSCLYDLFLYNLHIKKFQASLSNFEKINIDENHAWYYNHQHRIGYLYYHLGDKELATEFFNKQITICLQSIEQKRHYAITFAQYDLAGVYAFLGEKENAYSLLYDISDKLGSGLLRLIQVDPLFGNLWEDPEFRNIIDKQEEKCARIRAELDQMRIKGNI